MRINLFPFIFMTFCSLVGHLSGIAEGALIGLAVSMGFVIVIHLLH